MNNNTERYRDFWFADWDGYLSLYYAPGSAEVYDEQCDVAYVEAGMNLADLLNTAEEFIRHRTDNNTGD